MLVQYNVKYLDKRLNETGVFRYEKFRDIVLPSLLTATHHEGKPGQVMAIEMKFIDEDLLV